MDNSRQILRAILGAAAISILLTAGAAAQLPMPSFSLQSDKHKTPEQIAHDRALDRAYQSATQKIPDQTANDPWAGVRAAPPAAPERKKLQTSKAKKQQLSEGAKKAGE